MDVDSLVKDINSLNYTDKQLLYSQTYSLGHIGDKMDDLLIVLSLLALTLQKLKAKNPNITPEIILNKIFKKSLHLENVHFLKFLSNIAILTQDLADTYTSINSCGLKNSNEIINKIKNLLDTWTPF
jgi:hypothetical protein